MLVLAPSLRYGQFLQIPSAQSGSHPGNGAAPTTACQSARQNTDPPSAGRIAHVRMPVPEYGMDFVCIPGHVGSSNHQKSDMPNASAASCFFRILGPDIC